MDCREKGSDLMSMIPLPVPNVLLTTLLTVSGEDLDDMASVFFGLSRHSSEGRLELDEAFRQRIVDFMKEPKS